MEYISIFEDYVQVTKANDVMHDWKTIVRDVMNPPNLWNFKFADTKLSANLPGALLTSSLIQFLCVNQTQKKDVEKLLVKHYAINWGELNILLFYNNALRRTLQELPLTDNFEDEDNDLPMNDINFT
ncbi:hypothetical protein PR048_011839, partial [Dryococelus australis]